MTAELADPAAARRLVEARLGREPQDMLEAAVVLEAWGGVPAQRALDTAGALMTTSPSPSRPSTGTLPVPARQQGVVLEGAAFVLTVLAVALWAAPLAAGLGTSVVERALIVALPLTLGLQWGLRSRYLGRPKGLLALARRRRALLVGGCAVVGLPAALLGLSGLVAGLFTLTWTGGALLMRRRWTGAYAAIVIAGTFPMMADVPPLATLAGIAAATTLAVALALRAAPSTRIAAGRWDRAFVAGALGAGIGDHARRRLERDVDGGHRARVGAASLDGGRLLGRLPPVEDRARDPARPSRRAGSGRRRPTQRRRRRCARSWARRHGSWGSPPSFPRLWCSSPHGSTRRRAARACSSALDCWRWRRSSSA